MSGIFQGNRHLFHVLIGKLRNFTIKSHIISFARVSFSQPVLLKPTPFCIQKTPCRLPKSSMWLRCSCPHLRMGFLNLVFITGVRVQVCFDDCSLP